MKYQDKQGYLLSEKKLDSKHFLIIIFLMIFGIVYYYSIEHKTIGHDVRYSIYILGLPTIVGMLLLGYYRRQFLINQFSTSKGVLLQTFMVCFYLVQGLIFSYFSFGQLSKVTWDYCNYKKTLQNSSETFICPITKFGVGRRPSLDFKFNNKYESFKVSYSEIKGYENKKVTDYNLKIIATKGLWSYYTVREWQIEHK